MAVSTRDDIGGVFRISKTVDIASMAAVTAVDTTVTATEVRSGDLIVPIPPAALVADVAVHGCHTVADGSFKLRTYNTDDTNATDPASQTWEFLVFRR